jgi:hypothetical protein
MKKRHPHRLISAFPRQSLPRFVFIVPLDFSWQHLDKIVLKIENSLASNADQPILGCQCYFLSAIGADQMFSKIVFKHLTGCASIS